MLELSEYVPVNLICLGLLGVLGLRKLIRMEEHHDVLAVVLTACLSALVIFLFILAYLPPPLPPCEPGEEMLCPPSCVRR
jgi:hypothetical protein